MDNTWKYVPFSDLFDWAGKSSIKSGEGISNGKYKLFVCSDTEVKSFNEYLEDIPSLVFGTGGKASCHIVNEPFAYSTDCAVAQAKNEDIFLKFYYYYFRMNRLGILQATFTGSGLQHTSKRKIDRILVPIIPRTEQERIVSRIEEMFSQLDAGVETLKKTKAQLAGYRQAVLKEAFEGQKFEERNIEYLCDKIVDCPHSTPQWEDNGYLCLRTTNFKRGYLDLSEKNYVTRETFDLRNTRLTPTPGDVLYSREGAILGIACIIPEDTYVCLGQRMMLLRTGKNLNNKFLMYYLNSPRVTNYVASITGGSASPHVNVGDIKSFMIPCPEIYIQEKIVKEIESKISTCDSIEQTVNTSLQQAEAMRQSILKNAFEGRL